MAGKYWENEDPKVVRVAGMELRYFAQAGKLQIYQTKEGAAHGVTKGVVVNLADQGISDLARLLVAIDEFLYDSVSELMEPEAWEQQVEEASEAIHG